MNSDPVETVLHCSIEVIHRIRATSGIKCIGVCKEDLSAKRADHIHYTSRVVRTDVCHVSRLSEMNLYRSELSFEIDVCDSSSSYKSLKLCEKIVSWYGPKIRKIHFRFFHSHHAIGMPLKMTLKSPCPRSAMPIITIIAPVILLIHSIVLILKFLRKRLNNHDMLNQ